MGASQANIYKPHVKVLTMRAKCPHCETIFRITEHQLSVADGKVRCGLCHTIFTARPVDEDLTDEDLVDEELALIKELYDEKLEPETSEPELSEPEALDQEKLEPIHDNIEVDEFSSSELRAQLAGREQDDIHDLFSDENESSHVIPDRYRAIEKHASGSRLSTIAWSFGIIFLVFTLITEYAWFNRNKLAQNAGLQPWISRFCEATGCTVAAIHTPDQLEMVNRNIYTHPNIKNALMVTATIVNQAPYPQAYPDIEIGFSNVRGELVVHRVFSPEEYMKQETKNLRLLQPNEPVSFGIEIQDPGKLAMTYEFKFL